MIAFVLSGAGNRGPLQVGALQALYAHGIQPDLIVGTSAGAINGLYVAAHGFDDMTTIEMADFWARVDASVIYPGGYLSVVKRLLGRANSLFPNDGVRKLLKDALPPGVHTFADLKIPLYVTASDLISSRLFLYGMERDFPVLDAVTASASIPVVHPPMTVGEGLQLVDGGVIANTAGRVAMELGATTIYLLNASWDGSNAERGKGILNIARLTLNTMLGQAFLADLEQAQFDHAVDLHHIHLGGFDDLGFRDFSKGNEMVRVGADLTNDYLAAPRPRSPAPTLESNAPAHSQEAAVPGAREITPTFLRGRVRR